MEHTVDEFNDFAVNCNATDYYKWCNGLNVNCEKQYYYDFDYQVIFETYTMVLKCHYTTENFEIIRDILNKETKLRLIADDCEFNDNIFDVYYVKNDNKIYDDFKMFGFILINDECKQIDYCWFLDLDYDEHIYDEQSFCRFYELFYDWLDMNGQPK